MTEKVREKCWVKKMNDCGIQIENMSFCYVNDTYIFKNVSVTIKKGESVGIVGANGVGKSTLLRLIVGLEAGYEGHISVSGIDVTKKNLPMVRKKAGYVFQDADSQMFLSHVEDNVAFGPSNYGMKKEEIASCVKRVLCETGIEHLKKRSIYQLSGGEKKLASIACVLALNPDIIMFDEPSVTLDPKNRRNLINVLNRLDKTKLIASHDLDFILDTCDRTILLSGSGVVRDGKSRDILLDRELMEGSGLELPLSVLGR